MQIDFAPHLNLTADDNERVKNWKPMLDQVKEREGNGFSTSKILVTGVSFVGQEEKRRPLLVQARVFYRTAEFGEASYHTNFIPDAATLLVVFRVSNEEVVARKSKPSLDDHYVMLVEQARYGMNNRKSLEIPGGLIEGTNPAVTALREFTEEAISDENKNVIPAAALQRQESLGAPVPSHPALTDKQHQFALTLDLTSSAFGAIQKAFEGTRAGNRAEQESTQPRIAPLREAYINAVARGDGLVTALTRYMLKENLLKLG